MVTIDYFLHAILWPLLWFYSQNFVIFTTNWINLSIIKIACRFLLSSVNELIFVLKSPVKFAIFCSYIMLDVALL